MDIINRINVLQLASERLSKYLDTYEEILGEKGICEELFEIYDLLQEVIM